MKHNQPFVENKDAGVSSRAGLTIALLCSILHRRREGRERSVTHLGAGATESCP
jgi:hypothetical protein